MTLGSAAEHRQAFEAPKIVSTDNNMSHVLENCAERYVGTTTGARTHNMLQTARVRCSAWPQERSQHERLHPGTNSGSRNPVAT